MPSSSINPPTPQVNPNQVPNGNGLPYVTNDVRDITSPEDPISVVIINHSELEAGNLTVRFEETMANTNDVLTDYGDLFIYPDNELWTKVEEANFEGEGFTIHDSDKHILKMTEGNGFRIDNLEYEPDELRFIGFKFVANETGKSYNNVSPIIFNHHLSHNATFKDSETGEIVSRKSASGIDFRSVIPSNQSESIAASTNRLEALPNFVSEQTYLSFELDESSETELVLYNMKGQLVHTIQSSANFEAGTYNYVLDVADLSSGIYFVTLLIDNQKHIQKIVVY